MTTTTTASDVLANGIATLEFSRRTTLGLAKEFPNGKASFQPAPGGNHLLWELGHLAWTDDYFLTKLCERESQVPESWNDLFGMGSEPTSDANAYPSLEEVHSMLAERREALLDWFRSRTDSQLAKPLPEDWQSFAPTYGALMSSLAAHEAMHAGQITMIRKALGLKRVWA